MSYFVIQSALLLLLAYFAGTTLGCLLRQLFHADATAGHELGGRAPLEPAVAGTGAALGAGEAVRRTMQTPQQDSPVFHPEPRPALQPTTHRPVPPKPEAPAHDDLKRIRSIGPDVEGRLHAMGVSRYSDIASWNASDVTAINSRLELGGRIQREGWIEQATILAKGGQTAFSRRLDRGEIRDDMRLAWTSALAAHSIDDLPIEPRGLRAGDELPRPATTIVPHNQNAGSSTAVSTGNGFQPRRVEQSSTGNGRATRTTATVAPVAAVAAAAAVGASADNLQRIQGIGPAEERELLALGADRYAEIANWHSRQVARVNELIGARDRVQRENWVEQAQILARGNNTAFSTRYDQQVVPAAVATPVGTTPDVATRAATATVPPVAAAARAVSVTARPAQPSTQQPATPAPRGGQVLRAVRADDLKRIRGIGIVIEKKLHGLGVTTYQQIANWSPADIARVSEHLAFSGRIERENWVEQARILSGGGQTDFARRVDRGEVDTSRDD